MYDESRIIRSGFGPFRINGTFKYSKRVVTAVVVQGGCWYFCHFGTYKLDRSPTWQRPRVVTAYLISKVNKL